MSELPKGWVVAELSDVTLPFNTTDPKREPDTEFTYVDIGSIDNSTQTITDPKTFLGRDAPSRARRVIKQGDVLFSTVRTYLKNIAQVPAELDEKLTSTGIAVLRPSSGLDGRYLFNWVCSDDFIATMSKAQDGTLYPAVTDKDVAGASIPFPPLPEQRRIVAKVDGLTARTAHARKELDRIPTLIARYKQRLLSLAYQSKFTAEFRKKRGLPEAQMMPLARLCTTITDGDHQAPPRADEGIPFITISAMNDGCIDLTKATRFVPQTYFDGLKDSRRAEPGDVLFSVTGSFGIPALVEESAPFVFQRHIAILKPDLQNASGPFLRFMLEAPEVKAQGLEVATGSAQLTVPLRGLRNFIVPLPSHEEQAEIVRRIGSSFVWLDRMAADHAAAARLVPKLDAAILAKAFRGELVPQDPNDEPASALLERITSERAAQPAKARGSRKQTILESHLTVRSEIVRPTRATKGQAMRKSRHDDDVWGKPYLATLLKSAKGSDVQSLFKAADLPVADFYKQLAWEISNKHIRDNAEKLEAA